MDMQNPALNPPRLPSPTKRAYESRSPSHSPVRNYQNARDLDPLLRGLSPTSTLRAFSSKPDGLQDDHLSRSVGNTTHAQRGLGIKAAQTCLNLRSWVREIDAWEWPGTFDEPEPARKRQRTSTTSDGTLTSRPSISQAEEGIGEEYCGSLPANTVRAYHRRLDEISDDLDDVNVEELKEFVLGAHRQAGYGEVSADDSIGAIAADTNLRHLDDFTALVTATILQSLPYLSRLHQLIQTWNVRLDILRQASSYLRDLAQARTDLDHGWAALAVSNHPAAVDALQRANATFSRETMLEMKTVVQKQVSSLGRRLDRFLDALEGRQECVPEEWIEEFEELEEQYGAWVVLAEQKVFEGEWKSTKPELNDAAGLPGAEREIYGAGSNNDLPIEATATTTVGPTITSSVMTGATTTNGSTTHTTYSEPQSTTVTTGPTVTSAAVIGAGLGTSMDTSTHTTSTGPRSTTVTTVQDSSGNIETHTRTSTEETGVNSNTSSPRKNRSRHVPIVLDSYNDEFAKALPKDQQKDVEDVPPVPGVPFSRTGSARAVSETDVKRRAAFFNGDIEKSESLNRSKPAPIVRPFEHASNAFTRLFKRDKEDDKETIGSRNSSSGSKRGLGRKSSKSKMVYSDLMSPPVARDDDIGSPPSDSAVRTPKKVDPRVLEYIDMARVPQRGSSDRPRSQVPKDVTATTPQYVTRVRSSSKRSSRQDITALPSGGFLETPPVPVVVTGRTGPETYLPTGLNSPFHSPTEPEPGFDMPENWPLSGAVTPSAESEDPMARATEDTTVVSDVKETPRNEFDDDAIATDSFEQHFVSNMPISPRRRAASGIDANDELVTRFGEYEPTPTSRDVPRTDETLYLERPRADRSLLRTGRSNENLILADRPEPELPRPVSMVLEADEQEGRGILHDQIEGSDTEQEEEVDTASNAAAYFGSAGRTVPSATPSSSKRRLQPEAIRSYNTPPVNPTLLRLRIPTSSSPEDAGADDLEEDRPGIVRRASATSIETYPRSELRSIHVKKLSGTPSAPSLPQTPQEKDAADMFAPSSPLHYKDKIYFPSPPAVPPRGSSLRSSLEEGQRTPDTFDMAAVPSSVKRKPLQPDERPVSSNSAKGKMPVEPVEDNFDRHVSEVLDSVQASNIKFRTRAGAITPLPQLRAGGRLPKASEQSSRNMTLAPAETSPKKSTPADPEVKLYHLLQAGRSEPIKLYVRLVGPYERCMVRVGGGWADLADYLRQYAEHHGSRTVSENVELQTLSPTTTSTTATSTTTSVNGGVKQRVFSGPAALGNARGSPPDTPFPALERPSTNDSQREWLSQEQPRFTMGESDESATASPIMVRQTRGNTFGSQKSGGPSSSRPSTSQSNNHPGISSLRQSESVDNSPAGSLRMAGPGSSSKTRAGLPESKARWVESMVERVNKSASAEKNRGEKDKVFTDIGKAGTTRRLMFRKSTGAGGG